MKGSFSTVWKCLVNLRGGGNFDKQVALLPAIRRDNLSSRDNFSAPSGISGTNSGGSPASGTLPRGGKASGLLSHRLQVAPPPRQLENSLSN